MVHDSNLTDYPAPLIMAQSSTKRHHIAIDIASVRLKSGSINPSERERKSRSERRARRAKSAYYRTGGARAEADAQNRVGLCALRRGGLSSVGTDDMYHAIWIGSSCDMDYGRNQLYSRRSRCTQASRPWTYCCNALRGFKGTDSDYVQT